MLNFYVKNVQSVKQTQINCLSKHISVGTFSVVQLRVSTSIYTGPLEGIVVLNLLYDAILPIMKSDTVKSIRVNLSSASIDEEPHLPNDLQILPASVSVDLNPVLQNVTSGDHVSSDSSCGDGTDVMVLPHPALSTLTPPMVKLLNLASLMMTPQTPVMLEHLLMLRQALPVLSMSPTRFRKEFVTNQILLLVILVRL